VRGPGVHDDRAPGGGAADVDAVAFVAGPGRLRVVAARPGADLSAFDPSPGWWSTCRTGPVPRGAITASRAELSWQPGEDVPAPICALLDLDLFRSGRPDVAAARSGRPPPDRRAKGLDPGRLAPGDLEVIREALGGGAGTGPAQEGGTAPAAGIRSPAHRNGIEIGVVPTAH